MADALAELILEPEKGKASGTALLVVADYDIVNRRLTNARLSDGKPLPVGELKKLACDADILPAIYKTKGHKLWLGRKTRTATEPQKAALTLRDQGCVGCDAAPHWCQAHHINW